MYVMSRNVIKFKLLVIGVADPDPPESALIRKLDPHQNEKLFPDPQLSQNAGPDPHQR
jgi:hypothetical protein